MSRMLPMLMAALVVAACASRTPVNGEHHAGTAPAQPQASQPSQHSNVIIVDDGAGLAELRKVEFRQGVSSATVERLARRSGCGGTAGAGLITEKGPVEVYRMQCDDGTHFLARCELRQCKPMRQSASGKR